MDRSELAHIDAVVASGKAVIIGNDESVEAVVKEAVENDRTASFYLTRAQADAVKEWYWTPEWLSASGLEAISSQEIAKIRSELGIDNITNFRFAPIQCECGHVYGAFEFLQQGIRQHGLEAVRAVFGLESATFLQVNPTFVPNCPECNRALARVDGGGTYDCEEYGGCCCCAEARKVASMKSAE